MKIITNLAFSLIASVYFLLSVFIFSFTYAVEALGIFIIIITFLNFGIFRDSIKYEGLIVVSMSEKGDKRFSLQLDATPEELEQKTIVTFRVVSDTKA
jgi:hypothetical protein